MLPNTTYYCTSGLSQNVCNPYKVHHLPPPQTTAKHSQAFLCAQGKQNNEDTEIEVDIKKLDNIALNIHIHFE